MTLDMWPANFSLRWRLVTDDVMGGVSRATTNEVVCKGRKAICMRGNVSLDNGGGFVQLALDLAPQAGAFDASRFAGIELDTLGNGERYGIHLRSMELTRPQQSYRQSFVAPRDWTTLTFPFAGFRPHRTDLSLNTTQLRRIGLIAIGRELTAGLAIARVAFYEPPNVRAEA
jgi:hypothetical protein